ncbi:MAG: hypothetical protein M3Z00_06145 [Actinomycetota bacterium]|nr:hypothetical protein [Actinomycetota bacterium]
MVGPRPTTRERPGLGTGPRAAIFAVTALALLGLALLAGGVGPWTDRDISVSPPKLQTLPPGTATRPTVTRVTQIDTQRVPAALSWGLRLLVLGIIVGVVVLVSVWLVRKFKELADDRGARVGGVTVPMQVGMQAPARLSERASGRDFDPRAAADAIISCWLWVESAAAAQGFARRQQDTPTEFLHRFVRGVSEDAARAGTSQSPGAGQDSSLDSAGESGRTSPAARAAEVLLPLYQRARFDRVALTEDAALTARSAAWILCSAGRGAAARVAQGAPERWARPQPGDTA